METKNFQKGIAIYIALMIMTILLAIGLGLTVIIVGQLRMFKDIGNSVIAFHAADTGIEEAVYRRRKENPPYMGNIALTTMANANGAKYEVRYFITPGVSERWESVGAYGTEKRAIKLEQPDIFNFVLEVHPGLRTGAVHNIKVDSVDYPAPFHLHTYHQSGADRQIQFSFISEDLEGLITFDPALPICGLTQDCKADVIVDLSGWTGDCQFSINFIGKTTDNVLTKIVPFTLYYLLGNPGDPCAI